MMFVASKLQLVVQLQDIHLNMRHPQGINGVDEDISPGANAEEKSQKIILDHPRPSAHRHGFIS